MDCDFVLMESEERIDRGIFMQQNARVRRRQGRTLFVANINFTHAKENSKVGKRRYTLLYEVGEIG